MDQLQLGYPLPIDTFKAARRMMQKGALPNGIYSAYAFRSVGPNAQRQCRNRLMVNKSTKVNELSSASSLTCSSSSAFIGNASNPSGIHHGDAEMQKSVRKNSKKRARKKRMQYKSHCRNPGSSELGVSSEDSARGSSTSETWSNNELDREKQSSSCLTATGVLSSDGRAGGNYSIGSINGLTQCSEKLGTCCSYADSGNMSEAIVPTFSEVRDACTSEKKIISIDPGIVVSDGRIGDSDGYLSCYCRSPEISVDIDTSVGLISKPELKERSEISHPESQIPLCREGRSRNESSGDQAIECLDMVTAKRASKPCNGGEVQVVASRKKVKQTKKGRRGSHASGSEVVGNIFGHRGKENKHSVWQKVQRNNTDGHGEPKPVTPWSHFDVISKDVTPLQRTCSAANLHTIPKTASRRLCKNKSSRKIKRKKASEKEYNFYSIKGGCARKTNSSGHAKAELQHHDISDTSSIVNDEKGLSNLSRSNPHSDLAVSLQTGGVGSETSELFKSRLDCPDELVLAGSFSGNISRLNNHGHSSLQKSCQSMNQSNLLEFQSAVSGRVDKAEKCTALGEQSKQNHNYRSAPLKWVPIGMQDPRLTTSAKSGCSPLEHFNEPTAVGDLENLVHDGKVLISEDLVSSVITEGQSSENRDSALLIGCKMKELVDQEVSALADYKSKHDIDKNLNPASPSENSAETNDDLIQKAATNARRIQVTSEAPQIGTDGPISGFERLVHYFSPVIRQSHEKNCEVCLRGQVGDTLFCKQKTLNFPLGRLWQWYEKHGNYGLEIKAEDSGNSRRFGADGSLFRAYFVPYLSAVQLFKSHKSRCGETNIELPDHKGFEAYETSEGLGRSTHNYPSFDDASILQGASRVFSSGVPLDSGDSDDITSQSIDMTSVGDLEMLFEYFESEQPQKRRPLYDKIIELVRESGLVPSKVYGDPRTLDSVNLHDLHPRSWYSVAWYPIYRIPDGDFRAAFLTFHSLGHLICRSAEFNSPCVSSYIVSPVVGLQSYNARDECWLQLRQSPRGQTAADSSLDPYGILKERLTTLEETACQMARAAVSKGNLTTVNRHPDYEFFLSRHRQ